jgi:AraC-like DNA-binding protein
MHKIKTVFEPRLWLLDTEPAGSDVWVSKTNRVITPAGYQSLQMPSGMTLRVMTNDHGYVAVDGQRWDMHKGDVFCATPGVEICFGGGAKQAWGWLELQLRGKGAMRVFAACGMTPRLPKVTPMDVPNTIAQFKAMHKLFGHPQRQPHLAMVILHQLIHSIGRAAVLAIDSQSSRSQLVELACAMLESQPHVGMNVNQLASLLGVDRVTLQRAFKQELNMPPHAYLKRQRLNRACELLHMTDWPLRQVADACGYDSEKYFIRSFHQAIGQTPGQWRTQHQT